MKREMLKKEREKYKSRLRVFCKTKGVRQSDIANFVGISEQELYNMFNGFQESVGVMTFDALWSAIEGYCGEDI